METQTSAARNYIEMKRREREDNKRYYAELSSTLVDSESTEVTRGFMGPHKPFYTFQVTLAWVDQFVHLVGEMEMFNAEENRYSRIGDEFGNIEISSENIDLIRQRPIDFTREVPIAKYLVTHPLHNLPDLVLVGTADWVDNPESPEWVDGVATRDSIEIEEIASQFHKVLWRAPKQGEHRIYALDGQHRVVGVKAALKMIRDGFIQEKRKTGEVIPRRTQHLEDWFYAIDDDGTLARQSQRLHLESVGVKLVPAVIRGETWEQAIQRLASIFKAFNNTSVRISDGAMAAMDHEDGFAMTAKRVWKSHSFLKDDTTLSRPRRISPTHNTISAKSTTFTTLATLKRMAVFLLEGNPDFAAWYRVTKRNVMGQPPSDADVAAASEVFGQFWDGIAGIPSISEIEPPLLKSVVSKRAFPSEDDPEAEGHMLFRPIGQQALARAIGLLINRDKHPMTISQIFQRLNDYDKRGGFRMTHTSNPWWGVLYDAGKETLITRNEGLAAELLAYMLGGEEDASRRESLQRRFARARKITEHDALDLNGKQVESEKVKLPEVL